MGEDPPAEVTLFQVYGGWIKRSGGGIFKYGTIVFVASMAGNVLNYLFHIYMSRNLDASEYGALGALLSVFMIVAIPVGAIQTTTAKYVSNLNVKGRYEDIATLFFRSLRKIVIFSFVGLGIFWLLSGAISHYLRIDSPVPTIILGGALFITAMSPALYGALQGFQRFIRLSVIGLGGAVVRLATGITLVSLGFSVNGAIGASVASGLFGVVLYYLSLRALSHLNRAERVPSKGIYSYFIPVVISLSCFSVLSNADALIVKHYFAPEEAGIYLKAAIIGKAFLYLPMALVVVLFPKASELYSLREKSTRLLNGTLLYSAIVSLAGIVICFFASDRIASFIGKDPRHFGRIGELIRYFGMAITPIALISILVNYNLALHRMGLIYSIFLGTAAFVVFLVLFHQSLPQVLWTIGICGGTMFTVFLVSTFIAERRPCFGIGEW